MPKESWSILSEYTIYRYMMDKYSTKELRLRPVIVDGKFYKGKNKYRRVKELKPIKNSLFPDVDEITIEGDKNSRRPAEVKYLTSQFKYHVQKKYEEAYKKFKKNKGIILVYRHDQLPEKLYDDYEADIYELDRDDFIGYVKLNFDRLFFSQVKERKHINIWVIYAGRTSNFYNGLEEEGIESAYNSGLWSPKSNLTSMEINTNDIVIFIKTGGIKQQELQLYFNNDRSKIKDWFLEDIFIGKVTNPIMDREEFYIRNSKYKNRKYLWREEAKKQKQLYKSLFTFEIDLEFRNLNLDLVKLMDQDKKLVEIIYLLFTKQQEKLIDEFMYMHILQYIAQNEYKKNVSHDGKK